MQVTRIGLDIAKMYFKCTVWTTRQSGRSQAPHPEQSVDVLRPTAGMSDGDRSVWQCTLLGTGITEAGA